MSIVNSLRTRVGAAAFAVGTLAPVGKVKDAPLTVTRAVPAKVSKVDLLLMNRPEPE